mgnify:CR=1 FL=1
MVLAEGHEQGEREAIDVGEIAAHVVVGVVAVEM